MRVERPRPNGWRRGPKLDFEHYAAKQSASAIRMKRLGGTFFPGCRRVFNNVSDPQGKANSTDGVGEGEVGLRYQAAA